MTTASKRWKGFFDPSKVAEGIRPAVALRSASAATPERGT